MDLRTRKIYDALIQACEELLQEKSFDEITVSELCDRARTRRATFYKHFADKYDFLDFMLRESREKILARAVEGVDVRDQTAVLHALVDVGLTFVEENCSLLRAVESGSLSVSMVQSSMTGSPSANELALPVSDELEAQFLVGALNQGCRWWLAHMDEVSKEYVRDRMYALVDAVSASDGSYTATGSRVVS